MERGGAGGRAPTPSPAVSGMSATLRIVLSAKTSRPHRFTATEAELLAKSLSIRQACNRQP